MSGSTEGLYGGTQNVSSCDVNQLSDFLTTHLDKGRAWADAQGIAQSDIPAYLRSLTPAILRVDTRVTNHGFSNGQATTFQSVLQAGTAVLVDNHGVPRVRCACGNPLMPPATLSSETFTGPAWSAFRPQNVVIIQPAPVQITVIVLFDPTTGQYFGRPTGGTGHGDHKVPPPTGTTLSSSPPSSKSSGSTSTSPSTTSPCETGSPSTTSSGTRTPCPSTSTPSSSSSSSSSSASTSSSSSPSSSPTSSTSSTSPGSPLSSKSAPTGGSSTSARAGSTSQSP
ncbi:MAG: DUF6777 domain-containing protein [Catenulispora sp.]